MSDGTGKTEKGREQKEAYKELWSGEEEEGGKCVQEGGEEWCFGEGREILRWSKEAVILWEKE